jgi:transglutaminase/protease-like cytokinesis protein 3
MSDYSDEAVFHTTLNITKEDVLNLVKEIYYENPMKIVIKPIVVVEIFPEIGEVRVIELRFGYIERASILSQYGVDLATHARRNTERAVGENDAEILLSLAENLIAACVYDEGMAKAINVHGQQNFAATAYGALANGNAVGEGFAMAFKALCDELGFDCRVVLGYNDNVVHAWNIVLLNGDHYHIDVAMCAANGIQTAFLKTDIDFLVDRYTWNLQNTVSCTGAMTYQDIIGEEEIDDNFDENSEELDKQTDDMMIESPEQVSDETE